MNRLKQRNKLRWIGNECLFLGPAIVAFVMIIVVPFGMSLVYSFTSWNGVASQVTFNGIENYKALLSDTQFHKSFLFTAKYALAVVVCSNLFAFFLAGLLARPCRVSTFFRSVFFVPYAMSAFVLGFIWQFIFTKGFPILGELTGIGFFNLPWLSTADTGFAAMLIVAIWKHSGYLMVIYIAGFTGIPQDVVEAADVDGANAWQKLFRIKLPLVMPSVTVAIFLAINWAFNVFDVNKSLTGGGPFNSTQSVSLNIYAEAFNKNNYGLGTTKAVIFFIVVAIVAVVQTTITSRKEVEL